MQSSDRYEILSVMADGTQIVVEASNKFIEYEGKPAICIICRDVTKRKWAEATLRESEKKQCLVFESVPEGIIILDFEGKVLDINESAVRIHGYDIKEDIFGSSCFKLVSEKDHTMVIKDLGKLVDAGFIGHTRCMLLRKDGSDFPGIVSSAVLRSVDGCPTGFVVIAINITEQQRMQEQLIINDGLASIGQLIADIAHELNNPLTSVIGFSELLLGRIWKLSTTTLGVPPM